MKKSSSVTSDKVFFRGRSLMVRMLPCHGKEGVRIPRLRQITVIAVKSVIYGTIK